MSEHQKPFIIDTTLTMIFYLSVSVDDSICTEKLTAVADNVILPLLFGGYPSDLNG
ncbi:hypothetical protein [Pectobacterium polaris]|uniref:hypothetical protein n=1 Tax=Pectobacterium polaris TaxID=2042057 RepID=UPI0024052FE5|nr:hypothetical protein [Pectobacterium polaris]MDG0800217.1 hypothetical protein [Pectobacterium polaris]